MSKNKNTQQELAYEFYLQGYKYADIAEQVGCSLSAVKSWATRIWKNKKVANKSCNQKDKKLQPKKYKHGMHPNSHHNGTGPPGNKNSEKHGFYAKVLPEETFELFNVLENLDPIDILWHNIKTQYAIILRAQKIMYVKDINDSDKDIIKDIIAEGEIVTSYRVTKAWEKQANLLQAQSRAVVALNGLIKQYDEMLKGDLVTEERLARIEVLKAQVDKINNKEESDSLEKLDTLLSNIEDIANETN